MPPDPHVHVGVGVSVVRDNKLLLVKRGGTGSYASDGHGSWSVPGGWLDYGETPYEAAVREAAEETGVTVRSLGQLHWVQCNSEVTKAQIVTLFIRCEYVEGTARVTEADKCPEVKWVTLEELQELPLFAPLARYRQVYGLHELGLTPNPRERTPKQSACADCGHPLERHVKGSTNKHYCIEIGCRCAVHKETKTSGAPGARDKES